jgi:hypothetical protein
MRDSLFENQFIEYLHLALILVGPSQHFQTSKCSLSLALLERILEPLLLVLMLDFEKAPRFTRSPACMFADIRAEMRCADL